MILRHRRIGNADHARAVVAAEGVDEACHDGCSPASWDATWILLNGVRNQRKIPPQPWGGAKNVPRWDEGHKHRGTRVGPWSRVRPDEGRNRACGESDPVEHPDGLPVRRVGNGNNSVEACVATEDAGEGGSVGRHGSAK